VIVLVTFCSLSPSSELIPVVKGRDRETTSYKPSPGRTIEGKTTSYKPSSGRSTEGKTTSCKPSPGRLIEGKTTSYKPSSGRSIEGKTTSYKPSSGRSIEGKTTASASIHGKTTSYKPSAIVGHGKASASIQDYCIDRRLQHRSTGRRLPAKLQIHR